MSSRVCKAHIVQSGSTTPASQQLPECEWGALYSAGRAVEPPYDLDSLAELYETNATHKACVDAKVTNIVGLGYRFVRVRDGADESDLAFLERLFAGCNGEMTFTDIMKAVWSDVETTGNGYLEVVRGGGQVAGFYHVPSTTVRVAGDRSGFVQVRGGREQWFQSFGGDAGGLELEGRNQLLHLRKYTPQSTYYGVPDIIAAMWAIAGDKAARTYNLDYFEHNAVPRMAILVEGGTVSSELLKQIQQFMESEVRGEGHKTLVLEVPGQDVRVRLEPLTVGVSEDASFLGFRRANRDEIMMVHRVPPSKVTVIENSNLANSKDQDKTFREQVVRPEQRRVEYMLNKLIREEIGIEGWEFRFREMDLDEEREQAEISRVYADIGVWSAEEIRARQGLAPLPALTADAVGEA